MELEQENQEPAEEQEVAVPEVEGSLDDVNPFEPAQDNRSPGEKAVESQAPKTKAPKDKQASKEKGQPQAEQWDGSKFGLKYRGQPYIPKSHDELIALAQKGFSYSQELAKINQERQAFQQKEQQYGQYEQFDQLLKSNPALGQKILQVIAESQGQQNQAPAQQYNVPPELMQKVSYLEQEHIRRANSEADSKLDNDLNSLKSRYANYDWKTDQGSGTLEKQLLQFALDNKMEHNLEYAFRSMMWDQSQTQAKADALKQAQAQRVSAHQQGIVQQPGAQPAPAPQKSGYRYGDGYQDLAAKMAAEMSG